MSAPVIWIDQRLIGFYNLAVNLSAVGVCCVVDKTLAAFVSTKLSEYHGPSEEEQLIDRRERITRPRRRENPR